MQDKASLRKEVLRKRDAIPPEVRRVKNGLIRDRLFSLDEIRNANILLFFASFRTEVDTFEMIKKILAEGKRAVLPKVDRQRRQLVLYEIRAIEELVQGCMGISEPSVHTDERTANIDDVDVVIVPGVGFDPSGNRIGYGGGYYDRLLSGLTREIPIIAPTYEEQIIDAIPSEPHDVKVHAIVTDRRLIRC